MSIKKAKIKNKNQANKIRYANSVRANIRKNPQIFFTGLFACLSFVFLAFGIVSNLNNSYYSFATQEGESIEADVPVIDGGPDSVGSFAPANADVKPNPEVEDDKPVTNNTSNLQQKSEAPEVGQTETRVVAQSTNTSTPEEPTDDLEDDTSNSTNNTSEETSEADTDDNTDNTNNEDSSTNTSSSSEQKSSSSKEVTPLLNPSNSSDTSSEPSNTSNSGDSATQNTNSVRLVRSGGGQFLGSFIFACFTLISYRIMFLHKKGARVKISKK